MCEMCVRVNVCCCCAGGGREEARRCLLLRSSGDGEAALSVCFAASAAAKEGERSMDRSMIGPISVGPIGPISVGPRGAICRHKGTKKLR